MSTKTDVSLQEISKVIDEFVSAASKKYPQLDGTPSFAYPVGYLQSMLGGILRNLPANERKSYLSQLQGAVK